MLKQKSMRIERFGIFDSLHAATALQGDKRIASTDAVYKKIKDRDLMLILSYAHEIEMLTK